MKSGFDKVNDDLKKVHKGQSSYGKALDKVGNPPISCEDILLNSTRISQSRPYPPNTMPWPPTLLS
jgi:hypothetical protein